MDFGDLSQNQRIVVGGGVLAFVATFLPWFKEAYVSVNAWDTPFLGWLGSLLVMLATVIIGLKAFEVRELEVGGLKAEQLAVLTAGAGFLLTLLQLLVGYDFVPVSVGRPYSIPVDRSFGIFVGLIAATAVTYGCYGAMKEAGLELPSADDFRSSNDE